MSAATVPSTGPHRKVHRRARKETGSSNGFVRVMAGRAWRGIAPVAVVPA